MIDKLTLYLQYPFVRYALIVGVLIALCSSLLGVTLVLKRFSFIGDGLSHVAFGAMAVVAVLQLSNELLLVLPVTVISAILLLDEPVSGLDPKMTAEMYSLIESLNREGITIIMISHDIAAAVKYATHILHIGSQVFFGTREEYIRSDLGKRWIG